MEHKIDLKYLYWNRLPELRPKSHMARLAYLMGFVPREYVRERELLLLDDFNRHIKETVIGDRNVFMARLAEDRGRFGEDVNMRIDQLKDENARLTKDFARIHSRIKEELTTAESERLRLEKVAESGEGCRSESAQMKMLLKKRDEEIAEFKKRLEARKEYPGIVVTDRLAQDAIDQLTGRGYTLLVDFPGLDGIKRSYYVLRRGSESQQHAALRHMVCQELLNQGLSPSTEYGVRASVEYLTRREGKSVGVEVLTRHEVKDIESLKSRIRSLGKLYDTIIAVTSSEDTTPFEGLGVAVVPYIDFKKSTASHGLSPKISPVLKPTVNSTASVSEDIYLIDDAHTPLTDSLISQGFQKASTFGISDGKRHTYYYRPCGNEGGEHTVLKLLIAEYFKSRGISAALSSTDGADVEFKDRGGRLIGAEVLTQSFADSPGQLREKAGAYNRLYPYWFAVGTNAVTCRKIREILPSVTILERKDVVYHINTLL